MSDEWRRLRHSLAVFDTLDLAAGIGALQLLPENAERLLRFERGALLIGSIPHIPGRPKMSSGRWRSLFNNPPLASPQFLLAEDPAEQLFTESVSFIGGDYVVFPGIVTDSAETVGLLLEAMFRPPTPLPSEPTSVLSGLSYAVLKVGDAIARRAGLRRHLRPRRDTDGRVFVPPSDQFALLKKAVTFSADELAETISPVPLGVLDPIVGIFGDSDPDPADDLNVACCYLKPILRAGDIWVAVLPSGLLVALRHTLLVKVQELGLERTVADHYRHVTNAHVSRGLRWMSWARMPRAMNDSPSWGTESFWSFDTNKIAHVLVIADDSSNYSAAEPFGQWSPRFSDEIENRIVEVRDRIRASLVGIEATFHLVVLQGIGRTSTFALTDRVITPASETLLIPQSDLAVISRFEAGNPVALWKFAEAASSLRGECNIFAWSTIDKYGAYRSARHSFYLSDDRPPNVLHITTDYGTALRFEDALRFDSHGAPRWDGRGIIEVQRRWEGSDIPIYAPDPLTSNRIELLIETRWLPIWIYQGADVPRSGNLQYLYLQLCDTIAYWMWQAAEALGTVLAELAKCFSTISIRVIVRDSEKWGDPSVSQDTKEWLRIDVPNPGTIEVTFLPTAQAALSGPNNAGERELLQSLLEALLRMARNAGTGKIDEIDVGAIVDKHAPLGRKKMIMFLDSASNPQLLPGRLPPVRKVQEADIEVLLDEAGSALTKHLGLPEGPIPRNRRVEVLNTLVEFYFEELRRMVGQLSPKDLLGWLLRQHEAVVRDIATQRLTLPTQLACFGPAPDYIAELQRDLDELTRADQALRFLIEYATAQPPSGTKRMSLTTLDRLMALSSEIINKGMLSDALKYNLADIQLSILPSRRLGIDRECRFLAGLEDFRPVYSRQRVHDALASFERHWRDPASASRPAFIDELNAASVEELGLGMTEIAHLIRELINLGLKTNEEPKVIRLTDLRKQLIRVLGWPTDNVKRGLDLLALQPQASFPPAENRSEAYPWRFNRELSYVRRPLLLQREAGAATVVCGVRHLARVGPNLLGLIFGGRLKARSKKMRAYMGMIRRRNAEDFNDEVGKFFESKPGLIVKRRVQRIGSKRIERVPGQPLGDVDVLVVDPSRRRVIAVETKDFEQARTPFELRNEVKKLFDGKGSAVCHHAERLEWLEGHLKDVLRWLDLGDRNARWRVEGLIVVSKTLISLHFADSPIKVVPIDELGNVLN